jgi:hypothetical protein
MSTDLKDKFTVLKVDGLLIGCKGLILFFNISHTFEIIGLILSSLTTGSERWQRRFPQWMCRGIFWSQVHYVN